MKLHKRVSGLMLTALIAGSVVTPVCAGQEVRKSKEVRTSTLNKRDAVSVKSTAKKYASKALVTLKKLPADVKGLVWGLEGGYRDNARRRIAALLSGIVGTGVVLRMMLKKAPEAPVVPVVPVPVARPRSAAEAREHLAAPRLARIAGIDVDELNGMADFEPLFGFEEAAAPAPALPEAPAAPAAPVAAVARRTLQEQIILNQAAAAEAEEARVAAAVSVDRPVMCVAERSLEPVNSDDRALSPVAGSGPKSVDLRLILDNYLKYNSINGSNIDESDLRRFVNDWQEASAEHKSRRWHKVALLLSGDKNKSEFARKLWPLILNALEQNNKIEHQRLLCNHDAKEEKADELRLIMNNGDAERDAVQALEAPAILAAPAAGINLEAVSSKVLRAVRARKRQGSPAKLRRSRWVQQGLRLQRDGLAMQLQQLQEKNVSSQEQWGQRIAEIEAEFEAFKNAKNIQCALQLQEKQKELGNVPASLAAGAAGSSSLVALDPGLGDDGFKLLDSESKAFDLTRSVSLCNEFPATVVFSVKQQPVGKLDQGLRYAEEQLERLAQIKSEYTIS